MISALNYDFCCITDYQPRMSIHAEHHPPIGGSITLYEHENLNGRTLTLTDSELWRGITAKINVQQELTYGRSTLSRTN